MRIGNRQIGRDQPPYVIAEISGNHMGNYDRACDLITAAYRAGADAVKLQAFDPELIAQQRGGSDVIVQDGPWAGMLLGELYQKAWTPIDWFAGLKRVADACGIQIFASVFHPHLVDELEKIADWPAYKVASFNMSDAALLQRLEETGKPLIVSTGMSDFSEIIRLHRLEADLADQLAVLHCVSEYPCPASMVNLGRITMLEIEFSHVGFSDHTRGWIAAIAAVARGACIIEKHLMMPGDDCLDKDFSMMPYELAALVQDVRAAWRMTRRPDVEDDTYASMKVTS
jgi:N-acetylneuraminate synthase